MADAAPRRAAPHSGPNDTRFTLAFNRRVTLNPVLPRFPAAIVVTWATAKHFGQLESSDSTLGDSRGQKLLLRHCPWMASDNFDWIHEAPVITILATNLAFLISIMWYMLLCDDEKTDISGYDDQNMT
ncbi:Diuretic hormone receptor [Gryllus bimaculatus]|nr:Diuretic hormone receptor [Gryllus bimaculatus]